MMDRTIADLDAVGTKDDLMIQSWIGMPRRGRKAATFHENPPSRPSRAVGAGRRVGSKIVGKIRPSSKMSELSDQADQYPMIIPVGTSAPSNRHEALLAC